MPKYVDPSYEILDLPNYESIKRFERIARVCYKSENKISSEGHSDLRLLKHLLDHGHTAMIEFVGDIVVKFISNRGFSHEMVRHRLCSFAEVSTRYVNFSKNKFGRVIPICTLPTEWMKLKSDNKIKQTEQIISRAYEHAESAYMALTALGVPAEISREILPIGLQTEIVVKANPTEWRHIFKMRCDRTAHPRMRQLMIPLLIELDERIPIVFSDLVDYFIKNS